MFPELSLTATILALLALVSTVNGAANPLIQITNFGPNPSNVGFYLYVPAILQAKPPIVVAPHWCHGTAQDSFNGNYLSTLADTYGYIMIFPDSPNTADKCWDLSSNATLTHNGGGDSLGIVSMVRYVLANYNADVDRVFSMGVSSGAMMTNLLLGAYPDVFAAGSAWAGVPYGCYADPAGGVDVWSNTCATGANIKSGAQWAALVSNAYPGYTGYRPKMQTFHGSVDVTVYPQNLQEQIKQWTAVLGLPSSPVTTLLDTPNSGWTTYVYGNTFTATNATGIGHDIQVNINTVLAWFDLACTGTNCFSRTNSGGSSSITSSTAPAPTSSKSSSLTQISSFLTTRTSTSTTLITSTKASSSSSSVKTSTSVTTSAGPVSTLPAVAKYEKCGGIGYVGSAVCEAGSVCTFYNDWFSQCT